ncbi:hypothetical protein QO010_003453 [Caulobacter ginsengisoli]|uniref:Uncharacterized protein n=1 Tax=Caulobacter ginsengisoli TaxID=400775 RepID=A0ABU0IUJ5_9CAUL|nr:hypothetical protein [Caulobacter ginsengisoli]MDQ0465664.1 hypothetical protein [Caulobacter ginsengisoli]
MNRQAQRLAVVAIVLALAASGPAASQTQPAQAMPAPRPQACVPTALAIRALAPEGASPVFLSLERFHQLDQDTLVSALRAGAPSIDAYTLRDFYKQIKAGDGGAYDLACDWAGLEVSAPSDGRAPMRIYHPLVSKDGREALVMIEAPGENGGVRVCHLKASGKAWASMACRVQIF